MTHIHDKRFAAKIGMAQHVLGGGAVVARLCEREPVDFVDLERVTLGYGTFNAKGGDFTMKRAGWIECVVCKWRGELVVTRPGYLPLYGRTGQKATCGPLKLDWETPQ